VSHDSLEVDDLDDDGPVFTSHRAAFDEALRTAPHLPRDVAAVHLARTYAGMLDDATDRLTEHGEEHDEQSRDFARVVAVIAKIGPRYEAVLDKLGMSPGARPAVRGGEPHGVDPSASALDELRNGAAAAGVDPAAYVDPAVAAALADD
jgi:hypothetical protein